jgi:hypothetical protein
MAEIKDNRGRKRVKVKIKQYGYYMHPDLREILVEKMEEMGTHVGDYLKDTLGLEAIWEERKKAKEGVCQVES